MRPLNRCVIEAYSHLHVRLGFHCLAPLAVEAVRVPIVNTPSRVAAECPEAIVRRGDKRQGTRGWNASGTCDGKCPRLASPGGFEPPLPP